MAVKKAIKKILKQGKEGLDIASDYAYKKYKTTKSAIKDFIVNPTPYVRRKNEEALRDRERINKDRKERGLEPIKW